MTFKEYINSHPVSLDITVLNLSNIQLDDLYGIEEFKNLEFLSTSNGNIKDIEPLKNLKNIQELYLPNNMIKDFSALKNLTNLRRLNISYNLIINIDVILYFDALEYLNINYINNTRLYYYAYDNIDYSGNGSLRELKNKLKSDRRKRIISEL